MNEALEKNQNDTPSEPLSLVVLKLMKGVLAIDEDEKLWNHLLSLQTQVRDYIRVMGLELSISEDEGVAWLSTQKAEDGRAELPRLINKRQLTYPVSLLLALLRRKLVEHDASSGEQRLILNKDDVVEQLRVFLPVGSNEARLMDQVDSHINKIIELGFLRRLHNDPTKLEVRRIIKAFVDAQWLHDFDLRLQEYAQYSGLIQEKV